MLFRKRKRFDHPAFVYVGTFLFVFMAAWMILLNDPGFKARHPGYTYAAAAGAGLLAVSAELLKLWVQRKKKQKEESDDASL